MRWDRGTENVKAIEAQWAHWWNKDLTQRENERRGSALTGRSMQNCRAEYIWAYVRKHVVDFFRVTFRRMERELKILDPADPMDRFCLHAVYLSLVQAALDDFREMWNNHLIRGERTQRGHGGGVPSALWWDPIGSASVANDDPQYYANPEDYGVEDPGGKGDTEELTAQSLPVIDPLDGWPSLQGLRDAFFQRYPFHSRNGVDDYLTFKLVCCELLEWAEHRAGGGDWSSFVQEESPWVESGSLNIRARLAAVAQ